MSRRLNGIKRVFRATVYLFFVLNSACVSSSGTNVFNDSVDPQKSKWFSVIVQLNLETMEKGREPEKMDADSKAEKIQAIQNAVLESLEEKNLAAKNVKQYRYIPFMALQVGEEGLAELEKDPRVIGIEKDGRSKPSNPPRL